MTESVTLIFLFQDPSLKCISITKKYYKIFVIQILLNYLQTFHLIHNNSFKTGQSFFKIHQKITNLLIF